MHCYVVGIGIHDLGFLTLLDYLQLGQLGPENALFELFRIFLAFQAEVKFSPRMVANPFIVDKVLQLRQGFSLVQSA